MVRQALNHNARALIAATGDIHQRTVSDKLKCVLLQLVVAQASRVERGLLAEAGSNGAAVKQRGIA